MLLSHVSTVQFVLIRTQNLVCSMCQPSYIYKMHAASIDTLGILNSIFVLKNTVHCLHALTLVESSQSSILPHFCMNQLELLIAIKKKLTLLLNSHSGMRFY